MAASAYRLKQFNPARGLARNRVRELWHVTGIPITAAGTPWTYANTVTEVFDKIGYSVSPASAHPDPGLSNAVLQWMELVKGPFIQADGTADAIVEVIFDSQLTWGAGGFFDSDQTTEPMEFEIPVIQQVGGATNYTQSPGHPFMRRIVRRVFTVDASGITEAARTAVFAKVGLPFLVFGVVYVLATPSIRHLRSNQTIIEYVFISTTPVPAFALNAFQGQSVPTLSLLPLEEYTIARPLAANCIGKRSVVGYGTQQDPTTLPFWANRL